VHTWNESFGEAIAINIECLEWNKHVASRIVQNSVGEGCAALRFFRSPGDFAKHGNKVPPDS